MDIPSDPTGFAVVELFTSEGCSSCPAADMAVENLAKKYPGTVYVLSFHVDYWNRLGWTDPFSKADYTRRQSDYAKQFNLSSIYTPQVVINGREEFVGSNKDKLQAATDRELTKSALAKIDLSSQLQGSGLISVGYHTELTANQKLNIALIQNEATTEVKRGENGGRKLHHMDIVRDFKTVSSAEGKVEFELPQSLTIDKMKIVAYQQEADGRVVGVKRIPVSQ